MNNKMICFLLLFCISEMAFIVLISFVCGYCVGFYFFDLIRPRRKFTKSEEEIIQFFLSYKNNNGINNKSFGKNEIK